MGSLTGFLLKIAKAAIPSQHGTEMMYIIIRRPYSYVREDLHKTFERQEDVKVIVDRRHVERRTSEQRVEVERRRANRRRPKEEVVDVILSA